MKPPTRLVLKLRARKSYRLAQIDINLTLSFLAAKARREMASFIFSLGPLQLKISTLNLRLYSLSLKKKETYLGTETKSYSTYSYKVMYGQQWSLQTSLLCDWVFQHNNSCCNNEQLHNLRGLSQKRLYLILYLSCISWVFLLCVIISQEPRGRGSLSLPPRSLHRKTGTE